MNGEEGEIGKHHFQRSKYPKDISTLQQYVGYAALVFNGGTFALILMYCVKKGEGFLGGLDWGMNTFNWHPLCMVSGMIVCSTQSLLSYRMWPACNKRLHAFFQTLGLALVYVGVYAVFRSHNVAAAGGLKPNLYTAHGWMGMLVVFAYTIQWIVGIFAYGLQLVSEDVRRSMMPFHQFMGRGIYIGAMVAACMGISEKTGFNGGYAVEGADWDPIGHNHLIGLGYRVAYWCSITIVITVLCSLFVLSDLQQNNLSLLSESTKQPTSYGGAGSSPPLAQI